jgi:M6 family metalloprotease-like protein
MKKILTLAILLFAMHQTFAVPATPYPVNYQLPDGSEITIQLRGDERINWAESTDGYTMLINKDGFWEYAVLDETGNLKLSGMRAHNEAQRSVEERTFLETVEKNLFYSSSQIEALFELWDVKNTVKKNENENNSLGKISGTVRVPIILVGFQNRTFGKTKEDFEMLLDQLDYTAGGTLPGSLRDYFLANSYGQLDLRIDVFGPYILPDNIGAYDNRCMGGNPRLMARLAIDSAYHRGGADFSNYVVNNSNIVSSVHIIFAGYGQEGGAASCQSIWSHKWDLTPPVEYNGKLIDVYSCSPELRGTSGTNMTHIGVIAHELGHSLLNLNDFYSVNGSAVHLGDWCLMAMGPWVDNGRTPPYLSAYARDFLGWVPAVTLINPTDITLPNPAETGAIYRINTTTNREYFLLENRQQIGWDQYIPSSGMLICHTNLNNVGWGDRNQVNTYANNRGYYVKQAGCNITHGCSCLGAPPLTHHRGCATDPWPQAGKTEFTDNSTPNSKSWANTNTDKPITEITRDTNQKTVSFKFMGGTPPSWDIMLSQNNTYTFANAELGYEELTPLSVTITNTGNQPTGELTLIVAGNNADDFVISQTSVFNIGVGGDSSFTIVPKTGLDVGTHIATVIVIGDNNISKSFDIRFTVTTVNSIVLDLEKDMALNVYPNPVTNGELRITNGEALNAVNYELGIGDIVEIFDMSGKRVYVAKLPFTVYHSPCTINISHLPDGTYIVKVGSASAKIVKR